MLQICLLAFLIHSKLDLSTTSKIVKRYTILAVVIEANRSLIHKHCHVPHNMEGILSYQRSKEDDLYAIVGCDELSTVSTSISKYYCTGFYKTETLLFKRMGKSLPFLVYLHSSIIIQLPQREKYAEGLSIALLRVGLGRWSPI